MTVFCVDRAVWDHPRFAKERYTEREAWIWLIGAAAWKDTRIRVGSKMILLKRGECSFSERFLAAKWRWPKARVHRFIAFLKAESMVDQKSNRFVNHLTICNYDKYQYGGTKIEPRLNQDWTKEEEVKKERRSKKEDLCTKKALRTVYEQAFEDRFWKPYPRTPIMSKAEAYKQWKRLSAEQKETAISAIPGFCAFVKANPTYHAVHACRFLSQGRGEGFKPAAPTGDQARFMLERGWEWRENKWQQKAEHHAAA